MAKSESKNENKVKKHFFKDFKAELKKVIWPTPKQLVNNTIAVISIVLITGAIVFVLDSVFKVINEYGISNLQNIVDERYNKEESSENNGENSTEGNEEQTSEENMVDDGTLVENQETTEVPEAEQTSQEGQTIETTESEETTTEQQQ